MSHPLDLGVVQDLVRIDAVGDRSVQLAAGIHRGAVRQMPAVRERHAEDRVPGLEEREIDRLVRLRPRVRLNVGELGAEQLLRPLDRNMLHDVDESAAAVVAGAGIALGILVREAEPCAASTAGLA
jgi:hypothetical protein